MTKNFVLTLMMISTVGLATISCSKAEGDPAYTEQSLSSDGDSQNTSQNSETAESDSEDIVEHIHEEYGTINTDIQELGCVKATTKQESAVELGLTKKDQFLAQCAEKTGNSAWCNQLVRPNPSSYNKFSCTYGSEQEHVLVHPDEWTWQFPIEAVKIIKDLEAKGISVAMIYNWWRPEPYNKNVGGAAGRHPYGTSVDVRFSSNSMANVAFKELCKMRKAGRLRAIGHYGSASLHIGVGDKMANTWGKYCN
ncbi:hypothetical protein DOM22_04990 [Bdellovibrio sp. ZAP7]|uniref:hypothetical protein n=1 Tax=Bdellovibrio sp. ZAP7 TaxID=2231053 RepID=UPI00115916CD|nr:hypothetical protein [Bdellovibrio sp. ZAP7]QDK44560.1 hypothetical protein DOM22_04990 [Bdellovibrio sp. ZAP7]